MNPGAESQSVPSPSSADRQSSRRNHRRQDQFHGAGPASTQRPGNPGNPRKRHQHDFPGADDFNPVLTIGVQLTEAMEFHLGIDTEEAENRAVKWLEMVGISNPEED